MDRRWILFSVLISFAVVCRGDEASERLVVFTVATDANDGFERFMRSAKMHEYNVTVLGRGKEWLGGDVLRYPGGGQKVNFLKDAVKTLEQSPDLLVMFVDSYDVVLTAGPEEIIKTFHKFDANVVFSAESFCWPDAGLAIRYPEVKPNEKRFLNSGAFVGYVKQISEILVRDIGNSDDDQLYYTKAFLDIDKRSRLKIKLDTKSMIFQNLNGALDDVTVKFQGSSGYLYNIKTGFTPIVVHGNGPIKTDFNSLSNYLVGHWTPKQGCLGCAENTFNLESLQVEDYPTVFLAVFVEHPTAFLEDCLKLIADLEYPKNKIDVFIHYSVEFHESHVSAFVSANRALYRSISVHGPSGGMSDSEARNRALSDCRKKGDDYYFNVDGDIQIENTRTLHLLIQQNRSVISPLVGRPGKTWSNFWGAITEDGFYRRSPDYMEIIKGLRVGLWNVPYMRGIYLVNGRHLPSLTGAYSPSSNADSDMSFCEKLRKLFIFMYVDNRVYYGHMTDSENFETTHLHNDLFSIAENQYTWERKYLHPDYYTTLYQTPFKDILQPCPDVFWFPMVKPIFCKHLIEECENFGQWSGGHNHDPRLAGGYENVPTVDIHMNQIGFEQQWLYFLREYIIPYSARAFEGYVSEGKAIMNFVVRYRPGEQDYLRPHDDASTYTVLITLNQPGVEFQGGGTNYIRYNCSLTTESRVGWMVMHPGRLTHRHEGLKVTGGTRYIMVSFVDP